MPATTWVNLLPCGLPSGEPAGLRVGWSPQWGCPEVRLHQKYPLLPQDPRPPGVELLAFPDSSYKVSPPDLACEVLTATMGQNLKGRNSVLRFNKRISGRWDKRARWWRHLGRGEVLGLYSLCHDELSESLCPGSEMLWPVLFKGWWLLCGELTTGKKE